MTDVAVVGGGVAGLVAALAARRAGARVTVFERAPRARRGGNGRLTGGNVRVAFDATEQLQPFLPEREPAFWAGVVPYPADEFFADVQRLSGGATDPELVRWLTDESYAALRGLLDEGVRWQPTTTFVPPGAQRTYRNGMVLAVEGGGVALVEWLYERADYAGIEVRYETNVTELVRVGDRVDGLTVRARDRTMETLSGVRVVLAAGGFEANAALRARYLGPAWRDVRVRAVRYDTGEMLEQALRLGAAMHGASEQCHACPVDPACQPFGDETCGEGPLRLGFPYGITVNVEGRRFMDEGRDLAARTYAAVGRAIVAQPQGRAFQLFDAVGAELLDAYYADARPAVAATIEELAAMSGIDAEALAQTVRAFNEGVDPEPPLRPGALDGRRANVTPPKSNWANAIKTPPFRAYQVVAGVTFTYGGLRIDRNGRGLRADGTAVPGLFAAGDITGGFFADPYPAGCGITRNAVTGRAAGASSCAAS